MVYGPSISAYFAKWAGPLKKVSDDKGGYNGEFGTTINAENYALFALSVFVQETYSVTTPYEPRDQAWKNWDQEEADPYPNHPPPIATSFYGRLSLIVRVWSWLWT